MTFFDLILAFVLACVIIAVGFIGGTYIYFKLEDAYYWLVRKFNR